MYLLGYAHFFCFIIHTIMVFYVLSRNRKAALNRLSAAMFSSFALWSLCFAFVHNPFVPRNAAAFFVDLSAVGGIPFPGMFLMMVLFFTGHQARTRKPLVYALVFIIPALCEAAQWHGHAIMEIADYPLQPFGWQTKVNVTVWTALYYAYTFACIITGLVLLFRFMARWPGTVKAKQARIIALTGCVITAITLAFAPLSEWSRRPFPHVGDLPYILWTAAIFYAITRYRLFALSPAYAADRIIETMSDALLILDCDGIIREINSAGARLLQGKPGEVIGRGLYSFLHGITAEAAVPEPMDQPVHNREGICNTLAGNNRPVLWSVSILRDSAGVMQGSVCIIRDMTEQLKLEREVVDVVTEEQMRIGRDLHDGPGQELTALAFLSKAVEQKAARGQPITEEETAKITRLLNQTTGQVHQLSKGLWPIQMTEEGLEAALEELSSRITGLYGMDCLVRYEKTIAQKNNLLASHLYHIAREAVTNAAKHGSPGEISISLRQLKNAIILSIKDDGSGITPNRRNGLGIHIMQYRARIIGGLLHIKSEPGHGTLVECTVPIKA